MMVHISTMKMDVLLGNIYRANRDDPNFYTNLNENITKHNYLTLFSLAIGI